MTGNSVILNNGLQVSVDWLSFTITATSEVDEVVELFGYSIDEFMELAHGGKGYKSMIKHSSSDVRILYDGNEDMGVHIDVSGTAIFDFMEAFKKTIPVKSSPFGGEYYVIDFDTTFLSELLTIIRRYGHLTRFDIALDDFGCKYFSVADIAHYFNTGHVSSKFRKYQEIKENDILTGECTGHTVNVGKRTSEVFLRIYDKQIEQNKKRKDNNQPLLDFPWVRWELEFKDGRANAVADALINQQNLGSVFVGVLSNYVRIICFDDSNRSRCSSIDLWLEFIGNAEKLRLYVPKPERTLNEKMTWLYKQVAPTIAAITLVDGGDCIHKCVDIGESRMNRNLRELVKNAYNN